MGSDAGAGAPPQDSLDLVQVMSRTFDRLPALFYREPAADPAGEGKVSEPSSFEAAMAELEELVARLEQGELGLEESLALFERGVRLARQCEQVLEQAEQKVELLLSEEGRPEPEPEEAAARGDDDDGAV